MKTTILTVAMTMILGFSASAESKGNEPKVMNKLSSWVSENVNYPEQAVTNKEEGTVYVAFSMEDGEMKEIEVVGGVSEALDTQAKEVVSNAPVSELTSAIPVNGTFILPIKFVLK